MRKDFTLLNKCFINASIDNGFVLLRNALCSDKWKTATVNDSLSKWLLSAGNSEDSGFDLLSRSPFVSFGC